jgi:hypothetical protein
MDALQEMLIRDRIFLKSGRKIADSFTHDEILNAYEETAEPRLVLAVIDRLMSNRLAQQKKTRGW